MMEQVCTKEAQLIANGRIKQPHQLLGLHTLDTEEKVVRVWRPRAKSCEIECFGKILQMSCIDSKGLFETIVPKETTKRDYKISYPNGNLAADPYSFTSTFSQVDGHLFSRAQHTEIYRALGAHFVEHEGIKGVKLAVWAPNARQICVVGDFNRWMGGYHPMRLVEAFGVWELFVPAMKLGDLYKFEITEQDGQVTLRGDPFGNQFELRPKTASIVTDCDHFLWRDAEWMQKRSKTRALDGPMNIYEVHLGSWIKKRGASLNYREIAHELVIYCRQMGYTHVELLPITEHPLDDSWGYQATGYYAPTSRYGTLEDFQYFVNHLHMHFIGVILDWVPAHFPEDALALANFDGTHLFEHDDEYLGWHPQWETLVFNYSKQEVKNFLIGSVLFWLDVAHIDGIRVDAVASLLFLDYCRNDKQWRPNDDGSVEHREAREFLKLLNHFVHERFAGALMIAEDSSTYESVTKPLAWEGLGFDAKWNLGWMNDTLSFMQKDPIERKHHHEEITKGASYSFRERYLLPLSHDEVVHEKKSLLSKMHGDKWHKFASLRLYYGFMMTHPGKKLSFMGNELAQVDEWNFAGEIDWPSLKDPMHRAFRRYIKDLNQLYLRQRPLWEDDFTDKGFAWIDTNDYTQSCMSFLRKGRNKQLACVHNFTPTTVENYVVPLRGVTQIKEIMNSNADTYGGLGKVNDGPRIVKDHAEKKTGICIHVAPLSSMIFEVEFEGPV